MNIATQAEASRQLTVENVGKDYALYTSGKAIYKQYLELEGCKEKLVKLGEYDEKELQNFMVKKNRDETNAEIRKVIIGKLEQEILLSRKQLKKNVGQNIIINAWSYITRSKTFKKFPFKDIFLSPHRVLRRDLKKRF